MTSKRKQVRTLCQVREDALWPGRGLTPNPLQSRRHQAVATVLCSLPEDDYGKLRDKVDSFTWFIPDAGVRG